MASSGAYLFALFIGNSIPASRSPSFLQIMVMLVMAYVGFGGRRQQGRLSAARCSAGSSAVKMKKELQNTAYKRHHRRPHRGHRRDRVPLRPDCDSTVRASRIATGGGFRRLSKRVADAAASTSCSVFKNGFSPYSDRGRRLPQRARSRYEAHRTGQARRRQNLPMIHPQ